MIMNHTNSVTVNWYEYTILSKCMTRNIYTWLSIHHMAVKLAVNATDTVQSFTHCDVDIMITFG